MDQATRLRNIVKESEHKPFARVITVTSGKGGVGKTSVSVNLAIQLQRMGSKVIILDADFGLANIEVMLGIRPAYNLSDMIFKDKGIQEIITKGPLGVGFISGGSGIQDMVNLDKSQLQMVVQKLCELDEIADFVIIDTGAGVSDAVLEFVSASSEVILVVTPEPTSTTDGYVLLKTLRRRKDFNAEKTTVRVVANRVESISQGKRLFHKLSTVANEFLDIRLKYLGSVPQDGYLLKAVFAQSPVTIQYPNSSSSKAIFDLAMSIRGVSAATEERRGISGFFSKIIQKRNK